MSQNPALMFKLLNIQIFGLFGLGNGLLAGQQPLTTFSIFDTLDVLKKSPKLAHASYVAKIGIQCGSQVWRLQNGS